MGTWAGEANMGGINNTFIGMAAGAYNSEGNRNLFLGDAAGLNNSIGSGNVFMGDRAGWDNTAGDSSVFIGYKAGYSETDSYRLYIENSQADSANALIYGEFDNDILMLNATAHIRDAMVLKPRTDPPASPVEGMMYMNSDVHILYVYDGTDWKACWE